MSLKARALDVVETVWRALPSRARHAYLRATQPQYMVGVVGLIRDDQGRVLLLEHRFRVPYPWGMPGGFIEHGETPEQALVRELREETGLVVEIDPVIRDTYLNVRGQFATLTLLGRARKTELRLSHELRSGRFFELDALPEGMEPRHARFAKHWGTRTIAEATPLQ